MSEETWADLPLFAADDVELPKLGEDEPVPEGMDDGFAMLSHMAHDEETPDERSEQMRDRGNVHFRIGSTSALKRAIGEYTNALQVEGISQENRALGYLNRSAAEMKLKNHGKAFADAKSAIQLDKRNGKAYWRAAHAANLVDKSKEALDLASTGLLLATPGSVPKSLLEKEAHLAKESIRKHQEKEAAKRAEEERERGETRKHAELLASRGLQIGPPLFAHQRQYSVKGPRIDDNGSVSYPVLFIYPQTDDEPLQSDYVEDFHESQTLRLATQKLFRDDSLTASRDAARTAAHTIHAAERTWGHFICDRDHLEVMLPPPWDAEQLLAPGSVDILYRQKWTITPEEMEYMQRMGQSIDSDYVGSERGPEELGAWVKVSTKEPLAKVRIRKLNSTPVQKKS